jgi:2,3-bisphosphoglycerate-dependent phosphoglycerate mutase
MLAPQTTVESGKRAPRPENRPRSSASGGGSSRLFGYSADVVTPLWPAELVLVRHAESTGNVAAVAADSAGHPMIDIAVRDMDVELSPNGEQQARALGEWLRVHYRTAPDGVVCSPFRRAEQTCTLALERSGLSCTLSVDERLRERDFGMLDRLTRAGIVARMPEQAEARGRVGKFYYRPPQGESWTDVALRVRSVLDSFSREYPQRRLLVVTHEVVIYIFRYVLERLREQELLEIAHADPLVNCAVSVFTFDDASEMMRLDTWNSSEALETIHAPVTHESDRSVVG